MAQLRPWLIAWLMVPLVGGARCSVARGQPVNAEALRPGPPRAGWSGGGDASFALARGNIELLDIGGGARLQHQTLYPLPPQRPGMPVQLPFIRHRLLLAASGRFSERAGVPFVNQAFVHLRWTGMWHRRVGSDLFAQYQFNEFQRLRGRAIAGGGVRLEIAHRPIFTMWAGSGYMLEYERIDVLPGAPDAPESFAHRWTNYLTMRLAVFGGRLLLQDTVYCQPRFDDLGDLRVLEELEVLAKVSELFGLGATMGVLYDSAPPTGVRETDLRLVTSVRVSF